MTLDFGVIAHLSGKLYGLIVIMAAQDNGIVSVGVRLPVGPPLYAVIA